MAEYFAHMHIPELAEHFSVQEAQDFINETNSLLDAALEAGVEIHQIMAHRKRAWDFLYISSVWSILP
jgi:hypothetical protein